MGDRTIKILTIIGTRPEAIKMAPVVTTLREGGRCDVLVCSTGQHEQMLNEVLDVFSLVPDIFLEVMTPGQSLSDVTERVLTRLDRVLDEEKPDWVLVQGDTTSAFAAALAAFYHRIRVGHIEAGLRTGDRYNPWPEEINRRLITPLAHRHFSPTERAGNALLSEGVDPSSILVTGNTVVDALLQTCRKIELDNALAAYLAGKFTAFDESKKLILVTGHRRESFGQGFENICRALKNIAARDDVQIVYPVHLNPQVKGPVHELLSNVPNVFLVDPLPYLEFVYLMQRCHFIITDSGGIQEEAPALGKPVLVMRDTSERLEAVEAGVAKLVGTKTDSIVDAALRLLNDPDRYGEMSRPTNPFGDGTAAIQITESLLDETTL